MHTSIWLVSDYAQLCTKETQFTERMTPLSKATQLTMGDPLPKVTQLTMGGAEIHTQLCLTSDSIFLATVLYCFGFSSYLEIFRRLWKQFCGNPKYYNGQLCFAFGTHNPVMHPGKATAFARLWEDSDFSLFAPWPGPVLSAHGILCLRRDEKRLSAHTWLSRAASLWDSGILPILWVGTA